MQSQPKHTDYPEIAELVEAKVKKQRQALAIQIRVSGEDRALRIELAQILDQLGVKSLACDVEVGGRARSFLITKYISTRDNETVLARVEPLPT